MAKNITPPALKWLGKIVGFIPWLIELIGDIAFSISPFCIWLFIVLIPDRTPRSKEDAEAIYVRDCSKIFRGFSICGSLIASYPNGKSVDFERLQGCPLGRRLRGISGQYEIENPPTVTAYILTVTSNSGGTGSVSERVKELSLSGIRHVGILLRGYCITHPVKTWRARPDLRRYYLWAIVIAAIVAGLIMHWAQVI